ncbi:MAG: rhodanese-like domain-containing protein [Betaproteobacteria bacterium]|nr:rhodanese-like domain-containing protein [Betaproteobacteria bacterium]
MSALDGNVSPGKIPLDFVISNWHLIALALISGAMLLWPAVRRASAGGASVDTLQATHLINREDAVVLDVRDAAEFAKGRVLGARNLPLAELATRSGELQKSKAKPLIVVCQSGNRSLGAMAELRKLGFERVFNLSGGFNAWQQAGMPVEK